MHPPLIAVIVLNWNKVGDTCACIESLEQLTLPSVEVIVVDNGSTDRSVEIIRSKYPTVTLLETGRNLGYAGGNNFGIVYALAHQADYICILNNDLIVDPALLEILLPVCATGRIVTPMILEMARRHTIWTLGASMDWRTARPIRLHAGEPARRWEIAPPFRVDFAPGTALMAPRMVWETVGLFDDAYFLYYEESDWCCRARNAGFPIMAIPQAKVWHEVQASESRRSAQITYYMTRNALRLLVRNRTLRSRWQAMFAIVIQAIWQATGDISNRRPQRAQARLQGVLDYWCGRFGPRGEH